MNEIVKCKKENLLSGEHAHVYAVTFTSIITWKAQVSTFHSLAACKTHHSEQKRHQEEESQQDSYFFWQISFVWILHQFGRVLRKLVSFFAMEFFKLLKRWTKRTLRIFFLCKWLIILRIFSHFRCCKLFSKNFMDYL